MAWKSEGFIKTFTILVTSMGCQRLTYKNDTFLEVVHRKKEVQPLKKRVRVFPFGMLLPNRHGSTDSYRYGFQGQEKDDELKGEGNSINYRYRMHDPRVGRFFAVDPLSPKYPWYSPYQFAGNKVIQFVELEGLEEGLTKQHVNGIQNIDQKMINSLVDMSNSKSMNTNSLGWPRDPQYYWQEFAKSELGKEALSDANIEAINKKGNKFRSPTVDEQWNKSMKKYDLDGNLGEGIEHHHHNKGRTAYPRPKSKHTSKAWNNVLHNLEKRFGKVSQVKGRISRMAKKKGVLKNRLGGVLAVFDVLSILADSPHSPVYMFGPTSQLNRAFYSDDMGMYFEFKNIDKENGFITLQWFKAYDRIDGEWRGIMKVGGEKTYQKGINGEAVELKMY